MSPSAIVRSQARQTLKGNYVAAVASFFILLLPIYLITGLNYVLDALFLQFTDDNFIIGVLEILILTPLDIVIAILLSPLFNGFVRLYCQSAFTGEFRMSDLYYYFDKAKYNKTLMLNLSFTVRMFLPAILCFLPVLLYHIFCFAFLQSFVGSVIYKDLSFLLAVMSAILLILYSLKYFVVMTVYCSNKEIDPKEYFRISKSIMQNQKHDATRLIFSFSPWMLLCLLIIPSLYVVPYMTQSLCIGAKWMTMKGS